jgi:hypothetical protein
MTPTDGIKHNTDILTQSNWQIESGQRFAERAIGDGAAFVHDDDVIGQPSHLVGRMADVEQRNIQFVVQTFEIGQDFLLAFQVEGGQWLVHQQDFRADGEGAGNADTLPFTAGKGVRFTRQQVVDAEQFDGLLKADALRRGAALQAETQVAEHIEMGEQAGFLEDVANWPLVRGQPGFLVLPNFAFKCQSTAGRPFQPGNAAQ